MVREVLSPLVSLRLLWRILRFFRPLLDLAALLTRSHHPKLLVLLRLLLPLEAGRGKEQDFQGRCLPCLAPREDEDADVAVCLPPPVSPEPPKGSPSLDGQYTPFVFPVGWLGHEDPAFFTHGGGIPSLHLELMDAGLFPEWPSAIRAVVNGFGPRWIYLDRHSGVSLAGPLALGRTLRPWSEGCRGWEAVPWKGESERYTYSRSVTLPIVFLGDTELRFRVWCAFIDSFGPTVVLGRDFVLAHAVWVEFDGQGCPFRVHIRGHTFPCEPAERAWSPRR